MSVPQASSPSAPLAALYATIARYWGYRTLRPLQEEAMRAVLDGRDALVVLPTGGGKSLCYQAPAVVRRQAGGGLTVVVSPLIALMKDQVDALRSCGLAAAQLDSSLGYAERRAITAQLRRGELSLLFVSPERLVMPEFQSFLRELGVAAFAIDEAHCISHWGHDFRPEYRQLGQLKDWFPNTAVHAFTATATEQVRADIIRQLRLNQPAVLVGNFDRPNLVYRVLARRNKFKQITAVLDRHKNEAGIIYCIRRKDVDEMIQDLTGAGYPALAYHAGLTPEQRRAAQDAFCGRSQSDCNLIVATVAFGMGVDRTDLRFVLHAGLPKSLEAYQQETGRAGRDGLEAECVLLYSAQDAIVWRSLMERSAAEADPPVDREFLASALRHLDDIDRYARSAACRHQTLVEYFGQKYLPPAALDENGTGAQPVEGGREGRPNMPEGDSGKPDPGGCNACDLCLGETETVADAVVIAQKILSCVARVQERFGIGHVISVLRGEKTERLRALGHDRLSTYGLLKEHDKAELRDWIYQLVGQKALLIEGDEYPVLRLTQASWEVMQNQRKVRLVEPARKDKPVPRRGRQASAWEGVDRELFDALRGLRKRLAAERGIPAFIVFSDATLRELARVQPRSRERLSLVYGIGEVKLREFGPALLELIGLHAAAGQRSSQGALAPGPPSVVELAYIPEDGEDETRWPRRRRASKDR